MKQLIVELDQVDNFLEPKNNGDIIFDVDGTLMDISQRTHWVQEQPKNWDNFERDMILDTPRKEIFAIAHEAKKNGHRIIVSSGRNERNRDITVLQLNSQGLFPDIMLMRKDDDFRSDDIVKKEFLIDLKSKGFNPILAVDDRQQVVDMWREEGVPCYQCVEDGNF